MFDKVNVSKIIRDHISTLKDYRTNKYKIGDFILFFVTPLFFAVIFPYFNILLTHNLISILITSLSIFAALLFNLLLLIYDIVQKSKNENRLKIKFLKEIYSNISFCILIAIWAVVFLILISISDSRCSTLIFLSFNFIAYYLMVLFLLTLFMVLKRIHVLLYKEVEK